MSSSDHDLILNCLGRDVRLLSERTQTRLLNQAFNYWRARSFPFPEISQQVIQSEWTALQRIQSSHILVDGYATASTVGLRLANSYHPQIWTIRRHGRSAVDCFNDDLILRKALKKSLHFYPHRRCWNAQCLRSVLRFHHRSRVSNFRPAVARALYLRFSKDDQKILDFAAGFGGRLLAALSLRRHYTGIDPAHQQLRGLQRMNDELASVRLGNASVIAGCAEDILPDLRSKSFHLILSSPPYFNTECYDSAPSQSCHRYQKYNEWRDQFLHSVIEHGCRVLRPGGHFLLNVKDRPGMPIASDAIRSFPRSYRVKAKIYLLLPSLPHKRANGLSVYQSEPILVVRRPA